MVLELKYEAQSRALELTMASLFTRQQDLMTIVAEMFDKSSVWMDQLVSQSTREHKENS